MPAAETANLTYRLFREDDLPSLLRLWEEAGWGTLTPEQWRAWFLETPYGECLVVVAVDESNEIAAQKVFTPTRVFVAGAEVSALRIAAPIIRSDMRRDSLRKPDHPIVGLYKTAVEAARAQDYKIMYSLPEHGWLPFFRWVPRIGLPRFAECEFECVALSFNSDRKDAAVSAAQGLAARPTGELGEEHDRLWRTAQQTFPITCGVVRNSRWLRYKNSGRITIEVRDTTDGSLVGYAAVKRQTGLIADLLARRPADLAPVLAATLEWFTTAEGEVSSKDFDSLKVMRTPALSSALQALGISHVDYKFAFVCHALDDRLAAELIAPERWYIMPGD